MPEESSSTNKEKKLSQEENRLASAAKRFLRQISISAKNFKMFGSAHPFLRSNIKNAHELLKGILLAKESATFTFLEGSCLLEDIPIKGLDSKTYPILSVAKECSITSLTFTRGISEDDMHALLKIMADGPNAIKNENGLTTYLQRKNIDHIKADEIFFKRVSKKDEEASEARKHLEDFLIMNYIMGKASMSKDDISSLVGEVTSDPKRMGKLISKAAMGGAGGGSGSGSGSGGAGSSSGIRGKGSGSGGGESGTGAFAPGIEFARSGIEKIAMHLKNTEGNSYDDIKKHMGSLIMALEPSIRGELLKSNIPVSDDSDKNLVEDIIREFSDDAMVELIVTDFTGRKSSIIDIRKLISKLLSNIQRRKALFPIIEKRLLAAGVSQGVCSQILEEAFWSDMSTDERLKKVLEEKPAFLVDIGIADEIKDLVEELLSEKKIDLVSNIIVKILANFKSNDDDFLTRLIRDFEAIYNILIASKEYQNKDKLITQIGDEYKNAKSETVRKRFEKFFAGAVISCLSNKLYQYLPVLIRAVGYENIKEEIMSELKLNTLFKDMIFNEKIARPIIKDIACAIGQDAVIPLRTVLMGIVRDDFDSYRKRHFITSILKDLGDEAEDVFIQDLSTENVEHLRNALEALSEVGTAKAAVAIEKLLNHPNNDVRKLASVTLKRIKNKKR